MTESHVKRVLATPDDTKWRSQGGAVFTTSEVKTMIAGDDRPELVNQFLSQFVRVEEK